MSGKIFLDTNIILYQFGNDTAKKEKAIEIVGDAIRSDRYVISYQVLQEFSNVAIGKNKVNFSISELRSYLQDILIPLCRYYPEGSFFSDSLRIKEKYKYGYYDSLIINAAIKMKCKFLYSEDLQSGQKIEGLQIMNPFLNPKTKNKL